MLKINIILVLSSVTLLKCTKELQEVKADLLPW